MPTELADLSSVPWPNIGQDEGLYCEREHLCYKPDRRLK